MGGTILKELQDNFVPIPVFSWKNHTDDPMSYYNCNFVIKVDEYLWNNPTVSWSMYNWLMDDLKAGYKKQLFLSDKQINEMTVVDSYNYGDVILSQQFASIP